MKLTMARTNLTISPFALPTVIYITKPFATLAEPQYGLQDKGPN
ncbi:hypothetical protein A20C1_05096 [marine actinobacterium PHSC20C1]|nr:hypothetical protein A20C1_05096 [marine actinobacterium PHSC20C1]